MSIQTAPEDVVRTEAPDRTASRFARALRAELLKIRTTRGTQWVIGILFSFWVLAGLVLTIVMIFGESREVNVAMTLVGLVTLVGVFAPVLGILVMAGDWATRDVVTVFTLEPRRDVVFAAKATAAIVVGFTLCFAAALLGIGLSIVLALATGSPMTWILEDVRLPGLVVGIVVAVLSGVAYGAAVPRPAIAITFALVQLFLVDSLLSLIPNDIGLWFRIGAISEAFGGQGEVGPAVTATLLWLVVPFIYGLIRNRRADVS